MSEISELESRISAAMARIGRAIDGLESGSGGPSTEDLMEARAAAEAAEAKARGAEERTEAAEAEVARLREALEAESTAGGQLRERVATLKSMKESQQDRIVELEAEVKALTESRSADRDELDGLIAALEPLVKEQTNA